MTYINSLFVLDIFSSYLNRYKLNKRTTPLQKADSNKLFDYDKQRDLTIQHIAVDLI